MACVALPTCPLALAEAQRYMPAFISRVEEVLANHGLQDEAIVIRMTGCPNGCARPYLAEIGLIGSGEGRYNLHLGGDRLGLRLNRKFRENLDESEILSLLDTLFARYTREKATETFGDYCDRAFTTLP